MVGLRYGPTRFYVASYQVIQKSMCIMQLETYNMVIWCFRSLQ